MTKAIVAALTCRRPRMLGRLLASFEGMKQPEGCEVAFLIVDNAPDAPVEDVVAAWRERTGFAAAYALEREPGIPFGRNRGVEEALALGGDLLVFVDDDEVVDENWLASLIEHQRKTRSHLVGGPVRCVPPETGLGRFGRFVFNGVDQRYRRKEEKNARRRRSGDDGGVAIITNNWLADLAWLRRTGLRFDNALRYSGGSDTAFYHAARRLGAASSWCPEAIVYETVPPERVSLTYQFRRARDQAATSLLRKQSAERRLPPTIVAAAAGKMIVGAGLMAVAPLTAGRTLVEGVRSIGWGVGYVLAMTGRKSRHYEVLQGE